MVEIVPAILEKNFTAIEEKINRVAGISPVVQLDITDGVFVPQLTWHNPADLRKLHTAIRFDVHLMVEKPEQYFIDWNNSLVSRFTFHYESTYDVRRTMELAKKTGKQVGVALLVETPIAVLRDIAREIDMVLCMGVVPGAQGQSLDAHVVDKVKALRDLYPKLSIGVDGGVNPLVAPSLIEAGATMLVSGSFLFTHAHIAQGIAELQGT